MVDCFQCEYLPNRSTETALNILFTDKILSLDNNTSFYLSLLDLSSSFATLNHSIMYYCLREIGIRGQVHNWLISFVSKFRNTYKESQNSSNYASKSQM